MNNLERLAFDRQHIWHPYTSALDPLPVFEVESASGVEIRLADGRVLLDGMSSWWAAIHGYNHPELNKAVENQIKSMSHVMFGGLTHKPAIELAQKLIEITPDGLDWVFYSDSGSVAVEVAMKMALQYWQSQNKPEKNAFATLKKGYHGDTWHAMSVCDPETGMHSIYNDRLPKQFFVEEPQISFFGEWNDSDILPLEKLLSENYKQIAALILEPIVQGAGGMRFYHPNYLKQARLLCNQYDILLIADEIATGFGRTGKLFACEHAHISPDIMCLGKAITGGYMSFAATLTSQKVAQTISEGSAKVLMHGPTFMANPLACALAIANLKILASNKWKNEVLQLEQTMNLYFPEFKSFKEVKDVRVLGAIGVIELHKAVDMKVLQAIFVNHGIWLRPFGKLVYTMPPYIMSTEQMKELIQKTKSTLNQYFNN